MFLDGHKYFQIVECAAFWIFPPAEVTFGNDSFNVSGCLGQSTALSYQLAVMK